VPALLRADDLDAVVVPEDGMLVAALRHRRQDCLAKRRGPGPASRCSTRGQIASAPSDSPCADARSTPSPLAAPVDALVSGEGLAWAPWPMRFEVRVR
jgi:hypothetical protein